VHCAISEKQANLVSAHPARRVFLIPGILPRGKVDKENDMKTALKTFLSILIMITFVANTTPVHAATSSAYLRVNQVGYPSTEPKRAYLLSSAAETNGTFAVKNSSGTTVYSGSVGTSRGSWSSSYGYVYALDFDSVTTPGTYTITVTGPVVPAAATVKIDTTANLYSSVLSNALFFYQVQRDGPNVISSVMNRQPSHLNDASALSYNPPVYTKQGKLKSDLVPTGEPASRAS
jgi:endoglucanase